MKKLIIVIALIVLAILGFNSLKNTSNQSIEQSVLEKTYNISKEYLSLRYRTDNVLINAESFKTYEAWNKEMTDIINGWEALENNSLILEKEAEAMSTEDEVAFNLINTATAYNKQEISDIFDKAPAGKKIVTLAKHLGVDAKRAQKILTQDQAQVTADAWNEAGDTFQKLETSAVVIKDGCKVVGFVGTVVLTGGTGALATSGTLAQATTIVGGADLVLEITDDVSKVALGNHNKVSAIVGSVRTVTEPVASILTVISTPGNLAKGIEKLNAISFGAEQLNNVIQEEKILGIKIPEINTELDNKFENIKKYKGPIYISGLKPAEVDGWTKENNIDLTPPTQQEVEAILGVVTNNKNSNEPEVMEIESLDNFDLTILPEEETNDYQQNIRVHLFSNTPVNVRGGVFVSEYQTAIKKLSFEGIASIKISGEYDKKKGVISGSYVYGWEGDRNKKYEKITYSGTFSKVILASDIEAKINFKGTIESTKVDGYGKLYTTTGEGGPIVKYKIQPIVLDGSKDIFIK